MASPALPLPAWARQSPAAASRLGILTTARARIAILAATPHKHFCLFGAPVKPPAVGARQARRQTPLCQPAALRPCQEILAADRVMVAACSPDAGPNAQRASVWEMRMRPALATARVWFVAAWLAHPAGASELPTQWQIPPGDPLEHAAAGYAKILCSALFISGRDLATAADEDGFFVAPRTERSLLKPTVDAASQAVRVTLPNGITRSAKRMGDQGCVTLPRDADAPFFTPVPITSMLPEASTQLWPMGDRIANDAARSQIDQAKLGAAVAAAFDPPDGLTAAFVVAHKGRIIAERYQAGIDHTTPLPGWSMGKSVTASLLGRLIYDGYDRSLELFSLAPVAEWQQAEDPRRGIRVADLLRMSSGLRFVAPQDPDFNAARGYPDHLYVYTGAIDAQQWAISRPAQWLPNTVGRYRNSDPLVLNALIKRAVVARGEEYLSYPQR